MEILYTITFHVLFTRQTTSNHHCSANIPFCHFYAFHCWSEVGNSCKEGHQNFMLQYIIKKLNKTKRTDPCPKTASIHPAHTTIQLVKIEFLKLAQLHITPAHSTWVFQLFVCFAAVQDSQPPVYSLDKSSPN